MNSIELIFNWTNSIEIVSRVWCKKTTNIFSVSGNIACIILNFSTYQVLRILSCAFFFASVSSWMFSLKEHFLLMTENRPKFCHFAILQFHIISFHHVHFHAKNLLFSYSPFENSITKITITSATILKHHKHFFQKCEFAMLMYTLIL